MYDNKKTNNYNNCLMNEELEQLKKEVAELREILIP